MKFEFNRLGPIYHGELELADLTVLCGKNNTGKTYITNAIYSYLANWESLIAWDLPDNVVMGLHFDGVAKVDLQVEIFDQWESICTNTMSTLKEKLHDFLATSSERFQESSLGLVLSISENWAERAFDFQLKNSKGKPLISIYKEEGKTIVELAAIKEHDEEEIPVFALESFIKGQLLEIVIGKMFPDVFVASAERTGAAIFKNELNFNKNQLVGFLAEMENNNHKKINPFDLVRRFKRSYALSVEHNVDFISEIPMLEQRGQSDFIKENLNLISKFQEISGGIYKTSKEGAIYFHPNSAKRVRLGLGESSSAVRSMMIVWYWLNYVAKPSSLLMIDEPELNLHPENQRLFARFIVALVQAGIKVFLTTHSDYIIRELNTLVMLSCEQPHIIQVREKFGYGSDEKIKPAQLAVYNTTYDLFEVKGSSKRKKMGTLERWNVAEKHGIKIQSFDEEILQMNKIQDALLYGV